MQGGIGGEEGEAAEAGARPFWLALAVAHLAAVLGLFAVYRLQPMPGWGALLLYVPRAVFAVPALITAIALRGFWRLLPALTAAIVIGPLMGLHVNGPSSRGEIRLVTWNVWYGGGDPEAVRTALLKADPDLVLFQAAAHRIDVVLKEPPFDRFTYLHEDQYVLASRWPARVVGRSSAPWRAWTRFAVDSPFGVLDVFSVHPRSPRALLRGSLRRALRSGGEEMEWFADQLRDVDEGARHGGSLRILAGDFNTPEGAGFFRGLFQGTVDAFATKGNGYGYTFPVRRRWTAPWMRLDRVLVGPGLRPTRAEVLAVEGGSDHAAVLVELRRAP